MKYIDLHLHPTLKTLLGAENESERESCWQNVNLVFDKNILDSQSSLSQIQNGNVQIAVVSLYALESAFAEACLVKLVDLFSDKVNRQFLENIRDGKKSYVRLLGEDLQHLMRSQFVSPEHQFNVMDSFDDLQENALNIILSVEGAHSFYQKPVGNPQSEEKILENLRWFKQPLSPRLFYLTLTHLTRSLICTHAYGLKILKRDAFFPRGKGITELGRNIIRTALDNSNNRRILIDVKHMSLQSRLEFYELRQQEFPDAPIIASHVGVTGVSYRQMPIENYKVKRENYVKVRYFQPVGLGNTRFNPWSINLYDEEIREIVNSGGLIGLSLDQRILGCEDVQPEFFSKEEFKIEYQNEYFEEKYEDLNDDNDAVEVLGIKKRQRKMHQLKHLINNMLHILDIGGKEAINCICLGSDFDGLIDPIDSCESADQYPQLEKDLIRLIPEMVAETSLPIFNATELVHKFMYQNAYNFLKKNFQSIDKEQETEIPIV